MVPHDYRNLYENLTHYIKHNELPYRPSRKPISRQSLVTYIAVYFICLYVMCCFLPGVISGFALFGLMFLVKAQFMNPAIMKPMVNTHIPFLEQATREGYVASHVQLPVSSSEAYHMILSDTHTRHYDNSLVMSSTLHEDVHSGTHFSLRHF